MIHVGERAPDFTAETTTGTPVRLSEMRGKRVVVYFFPKAFTTGCSIETKRFRDVHGDIKALGAEVLAVSSDKHETQCEFASSMNVEFPMIGDSDKTISKAYGVLWPILGLDRRITFVIDEEGIVRGVFNHEILPQKHIEDTLRLLREMDAKKKL
jgi:thioredoxin-dependent peroxiredoxin